METVGAATWSHSVKSLRPGGTIVISGATSGPNPKARSSTGSSSSSSGCVGSTMGTRDELDRLVRFLRATGVRPLIDAVMPLEDAAKGFERMAAGDVVGKIVFTRP